MANILAINGPNLNLLGSREPHLYGSETLSSLNSRLTGFSAGLGHTFTAVQSNHEGELIDCIQASALDGTHFIILNPGGLSHTSVVLRDALLGVALPFIEVHLSNIHQREAFRQHSYFADIAIGTITGLGAEGYFSALRYAHSYLTSPNNQTIRS